MPCCRDLTSFDLASRLLTEKPNSRFENFVHESVQLGSKATVSAGCIVAKGTVLGDRCSVKRSIIGTTCKLGNSVKIVSSIVMDDVIVEEGSHIQNSIICSGSHVQVCFVHVNLSMQSMSTDRAKGRHFLWWFSLWCQRALKCLQTM